MLTYVPSRASKERSSPIIVGEHIKSRNPSAEKALFGGVLKPESVDAGDGFLIFGVPPAEIAIHDSGRNDVLQVYLMCEDAGAFISEMQRPGEAEAADTSNTRAKRTAKRANRARAAKKRKTARGEKSER